jgi:hypothetical protein
VAALQSSTLERLRQGVAKVKFYNFRARLVSRNALNLLDLGALVKG